MAADLASYRDEFEVLRHKTYLISASLGPVGSRSLAHLDGYLRAWAEKGAPDHVWFEDIFPAMGRLKATFSRLAGCDTDEVALTTNVSTALSTVLSSLALSGPRNRIVLSELDFPTIGHVVQAWAAKAGAEVVWLRSPDAMSMPLGVFDDAIDDRTALVIVSRILYRSSAAVDAKAVCGLARERGALSFVDDYHGIGVVPLDLHDLGCDLYAAGTLKFLCGGPGCVFVYCRRDLLSALEPATTGWFGSVEPFSFDTEHLSYHPTARRLESGTPPAPVFFIVQGGLDVIEEIGVEAIRSRQWDLQERVIDRADELALAVRTPREPTERGGVVNVQVGPGAQDICDALLARQVCTDARGDGLRISPHFFNTEDEIDRCFDELRPLLG